MPAERTAAVSTSPPHGDRLWQIDALRGLMLVLMTITHLPTLASVPTGEPFGFVSAAEGFVMLSAFIAGLVYTNKVRKGGFAVMRRAFFVRAVKIYGCQAALLFFLFSVVAIIGLTRHQHAVTDLMSYYINNPGTALLGGLLLLYNPPLLDILPMYIVFMIISAPILSHGLRRGWNGILAVSIVFWVLAQMGLGQAFYEMIQHLTGLPIPYAKTGSFELFGWQFLWIVGLWMGATMANARALDEPAFPPFPRWMVRTAVGLAVLFLVWRHVIGAVPFPQTFDHGWYRHGAFDVYNRLFDKWDLAPMRMLDFLSILLVVLEFGPGWACRLPRLRWLEMMGSASLPVFSAQLVIVLLVLATIGEQHQRSVWIDAGILAASFALLTCVAWCSRALDRYSSQARKYSTGAREDALHDGASAVAR